jgi:hypothetical protein
VNPGYAVALDSTGDVFLSSRPSRQRLRRASWTSWAETGKPPPPRSGRGARDDEHEHQVALIAWREVLREIYPEVGLLFAIPNGGLRRPRTAGRLKAEGAQDGVPDLLLPVVRGEHHGLFIEMKSPTGRLSPRQHWWAKALTKAGHRVEMARGWPAACALIVAYLGLPESLVPPDGAPPRQASQISALLLAGQRRTR